jgi:hypothetical protein
LNRGKTYPFEREWSPGQRWREEAKTRRFEKTFDFIMPLGTYKRGSDSLRVPSLTQITFSDILVFTYRNIRCATALGAELLNDPILSESFLMLFSNARGDGLHLMLAVDPDIGLWQNATIVEAYLQAVHSKWKAHLVTLPYQHDHVFIGHDPAAYLASGSRVPKPFPFEAGLRHMPLESKSWGYYIRKAKGIL